MNKYTEYAGIQRDVTWSDINYTPFANRDHIHAMGKAFSGDRDYILQGCAFSKNVGVDASVTAGYVFDETSGEVVQVDAQTVAETLGTNLWTLVKTTTYDAAGLNNYRTGGPNNNYQQERMVLTNVASIGSGFDVENAPGTNILLSVADADWTAIGTGAAATTIDTATFMEVQMIGKRAHVRCSLRFDLDGTWTPAATGPNLKIDADYPFVVTAASYLAVVEEMTPCVIRDVTGGGAYEAGRMTFGQNSGRNVFTPIKGANFLASNTYQLWANFWMNIV